MDLINYYKLISVVKKYMDKEVNKWSYAQLQYDFLRRS